MLLITTLICLRVLMCLPMILGVREIMGSGARFELWTELEAWPAQLLCGATAALTLSHAWLKPRRSDISQKPEGSGVTERTPHSWSADRGTNLREMSLRATLHHRHNMDHTLFHSVSLTHSLPPRTPCSPLSRSLAVWMSSLQSTCCCGLCHPV